MADRLRKELLDFPGLTFARSPFDEKLFADDHSHCWNCYQKISERPFAGADKEAYVTLLSNNDDDAHHTVVWVCSDCFERFGTSVQWTVRPEMVNDVTRVIADGRRDEGSLRVEGRVNQGPSFALASWDPLEVEGIARSMRIELSQHDAAQFLARHERFIKGTMIKGAYDYIRDALKTEFARRSGASEDDANQ